MPMSFSAADLSNADAGIIGYIPFACSIEAVNMSATAVAAIPHLLLKVDRFIVGTGLTTINIGSTFLPYVYGTSGVPTAGVSLPASGNTLLQLIAGDKLGYVVGGGSTVGIFGLHGCVVLKPLQDIKVFLNGLA
jgi:hypothetical protein